ncbi:DoxX family membrane protein [Ralstonia pseudosolanacearum]|uniref:DoxX family protein n=1 Tax=Ralstonia pseudosolanacearum TaxID=1310165 RepID=UPI0020040A7B|nr:DoxX family protein [Ralstonia pseudosolanacearum]MCK4141950.1 DoxX family membrane protein [Ralstonia pseudosolanacearum]
MSTNSSANPATPTKTIKIVSWGLRILAAAAFLAAGGAKLAGVPMMVAIFDHIGIGQWFRVVTGLVEVAGAIALLVPATVGFGGLLLAVTMVFAVLTHLFVIGGSPVPAVVLLAITATVAWLHRNSVAATLGRLSRA